MADPSHQPEGSDDRAAGALAAAEAWKAVGLVNDWIKHAETKATATLAASGVMGGVLYNLVKSQTVFDKLMIVVAPACAVLVLCSAGFAISALWPRLFRKEAATSSLYFDHIARKHPQSEVEYVAELREIVSDPGALLTQLGQQIWANSQVAHRKYQAAGWALLLLFAAGGALSLVALDLAIRSVSS